MSSFSASTCEEQSAFVSTAWASRPGEYDITLYNPAEVQSSSALGREWRFLSLYVDPVMLVEAFSLSPDTVFERPVLTHDGAAFRMTGAIRFALDPDATSEEGSERLIQTLD